MNVTLISESTDRQIEVAAKRGKTIQEICEPHKDELGVMPLAAIVNNRYEGLLHKINKGCRIKLIDLSSHVGRLVYQHGMIMIFLKAIEDVMGRRKVDVQYALSKGLYTEIDDGVEISKKDLEMIQKRMEQLVDEDIPFVKGEAPRVKAQKSLAAAGLKEKERLLEDAKDLKKVDFYSLDGFYNFFYGFMVPSTGHIKGFKLQKYRRGVLLVLPQKRDGSGLQYIDDRKLYKAFMETKRWQELLGIPFVTDLNRQIKDERIREIIQMSEALHEQNIIELAQRIVKEKKRIILISGPSSSGKTTFARRLCIQLAVNGKKPLYLGTDDYFVERVDTPLDENGNRDYECLEAVDVDLFNKDMNALLAGRTVDLPTFDFMTGKKIFGKRRTTIEPGTPIVIEGIHALNKRFTPKIAEQEKFKIYISPLTQLNIDDHNRISITDSRMLRRIVRDHQFRGHSAKDTIRAWPQVRVGENKNVFPYNGEADVFINSMHVYEIGVLKKYAKPLLEEIGSDEPEYAEAQRLLQFLKFFRVIEDDECIVNNSLLREFIGGSIFV